MQAFLEFTQPRDFATREGLSRYCRWEREEEIAFNRLVFRTIPTTASGYRALIRWTLDYLNHQCSDGEFYTIGHVLANFENGEFLNGRLAERGTLRDPIFKAIVEHAQESKFNETANPESFALTVPTTRGGIRAMATYTWQNHRWWDRATLAAVLSSLLRSPALNPISAKRRPKAQALETVNP